MKLLIVNNNSRFISDLINIVTDFGLNFDCKLYSQIQYTKLSSYDSIILSGRKKFCKETNYQNNKIIQFCDNHDVSLLGICYGGEVINLYYGGSLVKLKNAIYGFVKVKSNKKNILIPENSSISVYQSHMYTIWRLSPELELLGSSVETINEIFKHKKKNIYGLQFHPERSGNTGRLLLYNFLTLLN